MVKDEYGSGNARGGNWKGEDAYSVNLLLLAGNQHVFFWLAVRATMQEGFVLPARMRMETRYGWLIWRLCVYCALGCSGDGKSGMHRASDRNTGHLFFVWPLSQCFVCSGV